MEAAYTVFLQNGFEDFQSYSFEIQTVATQNLNPQRIREYMGIIYQHQGLSVCQVDYKFTGLLLKNVIFPGDVGVCHRCEGEISANAGRLQYFQTRP